MTEHRTVTLAVEPFADTSLLSFPSLSSIGGFSHCITTRPWNMAVHRGPDSDQAVDRRRRICRKLGLPFENLTAADQIHSAHVLRVLPTDRGRGREGRDTAIHFTDGLVCDLPGVPVIQFSADCPIIIVVEPRRRILGTAHASWRGTIARIALELIRQLVREFAVQPDELIAAVGPCAGATEYEVGDEVFRIALAQLADAERHFPVHGGKRCFDLRSANVAQLIQAGVRPDRISVADESTMSDPRFFSHRRDGESTGRFAIIAGIREA
ncbi:MAG TPA: polyphenol oxidase family protein [Phycisphaerae bacterium]|nr:polyphenol oxidase family protein [Phycisphaerae bacterium]